MERVMVAISLSLNKFLNNDLLLTTIMLIPVTPFKQPTDHDCGPACAKMFADHMQIDFDYSKFSKQVIRSETGGIRIPELVFSMADYFKKDFHLCFHNYFYFGNDFSNLSQKEQLKYISQLKPNDDNDSKIFAGLNKCIKSNRVKIYHDLFTFDSLENIIKKQTPILAIVYVRDFRRSHLEWDTGHFVLINGYDKDNFYYVDPHSDKLKFGQHKLKKEYFLQAMTRMRFPSVAYINK